MCFPTDIEHAWTELMICFQLASDLLRKLHSMPLAARRLSFLYVLNKANADICPFQNILVFHCQVQIMLRERPLQFCIQNSSHALVCFVHISIDLFYLVVIFHLAFGCHLLFSIRHTPLCDNRDVGVRLLWQHRCRRHYWLLLGRCDAEASDFTIENVVLQQQICTGLGPHSSHLISAAPTCKAQRGRMRDASNRLSPNKQGAAMVLPLCSLNKAE